MSIIHNSLTLSNKANRIISFVRSPFDKYISLSKDSLWVDLYDGTINDENPPKPLPSITEVPELISMVRLYECLPALISPCGELLFRDKQWHVIRNMEEIVLSRGQYNPSPTHLYISCLIEPDYYEANAIRILGLHSDITLSANSNPNEISYPLSFIQDQGVLHWVAYSTPIDRLVNKKQKIELMIDL